MKEKKAGPELDLPDVKRGKSHDEDRWMFDVKINGQRHRKFFPYTEEGKAEANRQLGKLFRAFEAGSTDIFWATRSPAEKAEIESAFHLAQENGAGLLQCVSLYVRYSTKTITVREAVDEYLRQKNSRELSFRTQRTDCLQLAKEVGHVLIVDIDHHFLRKWLNRPTRQGATPAPGTVQRRNGILRGLFTYAQNQGYIELNPFSRLPRVEVELDAPEILKNDQCRALLEACLDVRPEMLPYYVFTLIMGIRPYEVRRLRWEDVFIDPPEEPTSYVVLGKQQTKNSKRRPVDMPPNAVAWLKLVYGQRGLPVHNYDENARAVKERAGLLDVWCHDICRHTAATNHLAMYHNPEATSYQMGHSVKELLEHYNKVVTKGHAMVFYDIFPPADAAQRIQASKKRRHFSDTACANVGAAMRKLRRIQWEKSYGSIGLEYIAHKDEIKRYGQEEDRQQQGNTGTAGGVSGCNGQS